MSVALLHGGARRPAAGLVVAAVTLAAYGGTIGAAAPPAQARASTTVVVTESEFHLALSTHRLDPGAHTFRIRNVGHAPHALSIRGPHVAATSSIIPPGGRTSLSVKLRKGTYHLWCPVDRHRMRGMATTIKVR
ncbi:MULTISPECIES: hypothetical protein [unclassified Nonomuraea]|uniref:hypothetical protein n=1 Tax=unclassified Nonomuraea TaxID=2593643 RepID=UPI0033F627CC